MAVVGRQVDGPSGQGLPFLGDLKTVAAQVIATKGSAARVLAAWMPRANNSLPVPVSPTSKTVMLRLVATCVANAITSRIAVLSPIT